jgi:hypothetical protein
MKGQDQAAVALIVAVKQYLAQEAVLEDPVHSQLASRMA